MHDVGDMNAVLLPLNAMSLRDRQGRDAENEDNRGHDDRADAEDIGMNSGRLLVSTVLLLVSALEAAGQAFLRGIGAKPSQSQQHR